MRDIISIEWKNMREYSGGNIWIYENLIDLTDSKMIYSPHDCCQKNSNCFSFANAFFI
jgi:hypothetical protein